MTKNPNHEKTARLQIVEAQTPDADEIAARLQHHIAAAFGPRDESALSLLAYGADDKLVGGLNGVLHWRWLYVRHLWVDLDLRGQGLAGRLLTRAEAEARKRGAIGVYIDTFDPAVAAFYERRGFRAFGEIADFPPGARRSFLQKSL